MCILPTTDVVGSFKLKGEYMKNFTRKAVSATLLLGLSVPVSALAADQDLQQKIDGLTQEVEALKHDVDQSKKKSIGQWLTIGGDYRVRFDSLRGKTAAYSDVNQTFAAAQNALQTGFFTAPDSATAEAFRQQLGGLMTFSNAMKQATTFNAANAFFGTLLNPAAPHGPTNPTFGEMAQGLAQVRVPATTVANDSMYTNRFGLNLHAKATEDVTVNARLLMYKVTG